MAHVSCAPAEVLQVLQSMWVLGLEPYQMNIRMLIKKRKYRRNVHIESLNMCIDVHFCSEPVQFFPPPPTPRVGNWGGGGGGVGGLRVFASACQVTQCDEDTYPYALAGCQPDTCTGLIDLASASRRFRTGSRAENEVSAERHRSIGYHRLHLHRKLPCYATRSGQREVLLKDSRIAEADLLCVCVCVRHNFDVSVECASGYEGNPAATVCDGHGKSFTIDPWRILGRVMFGRVIGVERPTYGRCEIHLPSLAGPSCLANVSWFRH